MSNFPTHFIADLRYSIAYPDLDAGRWFQWSSVPLIELSALDTYPFVKSMLLQSPQTIVGSAVATVISPLSWPEMATRCWASMCRQTVSR
jgi:hypothetical protein